MAGQITEWVSLSDFSPGIHSDIHGANGNPAGTTRGAIPRNGAATIEHTYACHADSTGALVPMPAKTQFKTQTLLPGGNANGTSTYYPASMIGAYLIDAKVSEYSLLSTLWQFAYSTGGGGSNYVRMFLGRHYGSSTFDFLWESANPTTFSSTSYTLSGGGLGPAFAAKSATFPVPFDNVARGFFAAIDNLNATHAAAPIVAGETPLTTYDADVSANYPLGVGSFPGGLFIRCGTVNGVVTQTSGATPTRVAANPYLAVSHQSRIVTANIVSAGTFAGTGLFQTWIGYTPPHDPLGTASTNMHGGFLLDRGEFQGVAAMASLTADELLIIGNSGGAILVRGDVANPTVVQLPFVAPGVGWPCYPAVSDAGVTYLSGDGVHMWSGGDTSERVSTQIEGNFWNYFASGEVVSTWFAARGRLASWGQFVLIPNAFAYDFEGKSWWRLVDPSSNDSVPYSVYEASPSSDFLFAFPYKLTATQNTVADKFDRTVLASSYSWRSQPILESRDRLFTVQQVELVAANSAASDSTVTVTIEGIAADGQLESRTVTFTLTGTATSGGRPQIIRQSLTDGGSITARYLQVRLQASNSNSSAAPKILTVAFGVGDRSRVPGD